jgi:hypothetical protein
MSKLKIISEIMIYWKKFCTMKIPKPNEGLSYENFILFIHVLAINIFSIISKVFEFNFSEVWSLKCHSITKFKQFSFELNLSLK